jgi:hypothetical protein
VFTLLVVDLPAAKLSVCGARKMMIRVSTRRCDWINLIPEILPLLPEQM